MKYLLGIDFGGSSAKATLLDTGGRIAAEYSAEYPTLYPQLGFCEQRPADWINALCLCTRALLQKLSSADSILAVAVDSATHTWVACDDRFRQLFPAVHWTDSRSSAEAAELRERRGDEIFRMTYHKPDTIWTLPQLLWMRRREPEAYSRIAHLFFEKDYIRFFLTGVWCTDTIEAQGSMLYDCVRKTWSPSLCEEAGLPLSALPPLVRPDDFVGKITAEAAAASGLREGTPVLCGTTDTVMEILASGAIRPGDTTVKLATAGRICVITERPVPDRDLVNYAHVVPGLWYPGAATKAAAASLRWYRDTFGGSYQELDEAAADIPLGSEGLMYHPYINGELTPYADPDLCGSFTGIRATHTRAHFTRSLLEGVAFSLMASRRKLQELGIGGAQQAVLIGGGAKSRLWQHIIADALGLELTLTASSDSSLGSAMLAGVAAGVFSGYAQAVKRCVRPTGSVKPDPEHTERYARLYEEYVRIHDALAPLYRERQS